MTELLRLWADLVAVASFWPAVVLTFYGLFVAAAILAIAVQVARAVGRLLLAWMRRRHLHLVEPPDRERTLAAIATATPVITERGAWPETTVRPVRGRLAGRIARRRAERGEGGNDAA
jgi:hypothetical protein